MVVSELRGEKIDIIPFNEEPARFVAKALSPARVREVLVDDESKQASVVVPDDQLSLAIGKEGQNARLAARLTGWRVDIRSETEFAAEEADMSYDDDDASGRCHAIMSTGKRCPNAALPGSRYCGLPAHQALEGKDTDQVEAEPAPVEAGASAEEAAAAAEEPGEAPVAAEAPERAAEEVVEPIASGEPEAEAAVEPPPPAEPEVETAAEEAAPEEAVAEEPAPTEEPEPVAGEEPEADTPDPESSAAAAEPAPAEEPAS
jgi:N utilization substance protein A